MRNKIIISVFTVMLLVIGVFCFFQSNKKNSNVEFSVSVSSDNNIEIIDCWMNENNEYYIFIPSYAELYQSKFYLPLDSSLKINGIEITDGMSCENFEYNIPYNLTFLNFGKTYYSCVTFLKSANVATAYIDTKSGSMEYIHSKKGNQETADISLYNPDGTLNFSGNIISFKGRGNNSWEYFDKKSYSMTLSTDADLLKMGNANKWILLSNADDPSNLRNKIVYDFAKEIKLNYSPDSKWVDLYLNGDYVGLYLLSERNEVHSERVNISQYGSFLVSMELEERLKAQNYTYISTNENQALRIHYPLTLTEKNTETILKKWQSVENSLLAENGVDYITGKNWQELIDIDSWAKKFLLEEFFANYDACLVSQYFYCDGNDSNGKIYAGPVWDFDHSIGNRAIWQLHYSNGLVGNRLYVKNGHESPWFYSLYQKEEFYNKIIGFYKTEFLPLINQTFNDKIKDYSKQIYSASDMNQIRWFSGTYDLNEETNYICMYMSERKDFLSSIWLDKKEYNIVTLDNSLGANYAYCAVQIGGTISHLPELNNNDYSVFSGWYYKDTNEPFDISKPIYEDTKIYAKWQDSSYKKTEQIIKLIPIAVIAVLFIILVAIELKRIKGKR